MNLGMPEMLFIFVLALLIFGPKKLPEIGKQVGKALGEFRRASQSFQAQLNHEVQKLEAEQRPAPPPPQTVYADGATEGGKHILETEDHITGAAGEATPAPVAAPTDAAAAAATAPPEPGTEIKAANA